MKLEKVLDGSLLSKIICMDHNAEQTANNLYYQTNLYYVTMRTAIKV